MYMYIHVSADNEAAVAGGDPSLSLSSLPNDLSTNEEVEPTEEMACQFPVRDYIVGKVWYMYMYFLFLTPARITRQSVMCTCFNER